MIILIIIIIIIIMIIIIIIITTTRGRGGGELASELEREREFLLDFYIFAYPGNTDYIILYLLACLQIILLLFLLETFCFREKKSEKCVYCKR